MRMYIWLYSQHTNTKLTCLWTGEIDTVTEIRTEDLGKVRGHRQLSPFTLTPRDVRKILIGHGGPPGHSGSNNMMLSFQYLTSSQDKKKDKAIENGETGCPQDGTEVERSTTGGRRMWKLAD
ncbi:hypothetical protein ROHU_018772 [Labeo rohita]|uniref:Uncharacterized protein n=1 Tax=Labeo rohita TaxID=84645 RepID=A0A498N9Q0_LABRO|nr:hypothetical protein ROHU_018772 [Labeo rohita]